MKATLTIQHADIFADTPRYTRLARDISLMALQHNLWTALVLDAQANTQSTVIVRGHPKAIQAFLDGGDADGIPWERAAIQRASAAFRVEQDEPDVLASDA